MGCKDMGFLRGSGTLVAKRNIPYIYFMLIVPALYIKSGKLAAFRPGDYENLEYLNYDPYELIQLLGEQEMRRIFLVDIDASQRNETNNKGLIGSLCNTSIPNLEVGGGITEMSYLKSLQYAGVDHFVIGTSAQTDPDFLREISEAKHVKNERIKIGIDRFNGHLTNQGFSHESSISLPMEIESCLALGFTHFHLTDVDSEHPERGPDLGFFSQLVEAYPSASFSASGHINTFEDVDNLKAVGIQEVTVGNQIYKEPGILAEVAAYNKAEGY